MGGILSGKTGDDDPVKLAEWGEVRGPRGKAPPLASVLHTLSLLELILLPADLSFPPHRDWTWIGIEQRGGLTHRLDPQRPSPHLLAPSNTRDLTV